MRIQCSGFPAYVYLKKKEKENIMPQKNLIYKSNNLKKNPRIHLITNVKDLHEEIKILKKP